MAFSGAAGMSSGADQQGEFRNRNHNHSYAPYAGQDDSADDYEGLFELSGLTLYEFNLNGRPTGRATRWPGDYYDDGYHRGRGHIHGAHIPSRHGRDRDRHRGRHRRRSWLEHLDPEELQRAIDEHRFLEWYWDYICFIFEQLIATIPAMTVFLLMGFTIWFLTHVIPQHGISSLWDFSIVVPRPTASSATPTGIAINGTMDNDNQNNHGSKYTPAHFPRDIAKATSLANNEACHDNLHADKHPLEHLLNLNHNMSNASASAFESVYNTESKTTHVQDSITSELEMLTGFAGNSVPATQAYNHEDAAVTSKDMDVQTTLGPLKFRRGFQNHSAAATFSVTAFEPLSLTDSSVFVSPAESFLYTESPVIHTQNPSSVSSPAETMISAFTAAGSPKSPSERSAGMVNLMLASQSPHTNDATFKSPSENGSGTSMEEYPSLYTLMPKHSPTSTETSTSTRTITITVEKASSAQESRFSQSPSETFLLSSATSKISPSAKSFSDSEISSSSSTFFSEDSSATFIQFPTEVDSNLSPTTSRPISTLPSDTLLSLGSDTNSTISINHLLLATVASPPPSPSSSPSSSSPPLSTSSMNTDTTTSYWPTLTSRSSSAPGYGMCFDPRLNMNVPCSATGTLPAAPALATTSTTTSAAAAAAGVTNSLIHRFPAAWCICVTVVVALVSLVGLL